ncbi:MAG: pilus assembly protein PilO [Candidatus Binatia bacterium]|nr:MAG: pilus assembly protein PilO [Candidatus Binatia bacterium]
MMAILERFFELPLRQRVLFGLTLFLGSLFLYLSWFYWPLSAQVRERRELVENLKVRLERERKLAANLDRMRQIVAELDAALRKATAQLPDGKEIPELLSSISSLGREAGLEILVFRQEPERYQDFYAEVPVQIQAAGSYYQLASFFQKLGRLDRIVNVSGIRIREESVEGGNVRLTTQCSVTTYRFLDAEERERLAKKKEDGK